MPRTLFWPVLLAAVSILVTTAIRAFETPWVWNFDQCIALAALACVPIGIVRWGLIWKQSGLEGVKSKISTFQAELESPRARINHRWYLVFWIVVAVALVVYFNLKQN